MSMRPSRVGSALIFLAIMVLAGKLAAQAGLDLDKTYDKRELMIPMRDGVKLYTLLYAPKDRSRSYPIMLQRTPYSVRYYGPELQRASLGPSRHFAPAGYIFAYQDVRGQFRSEGEFKVLRPLSTQGQVDESTDAYDSIEWLVENVASNNGRVGMWGISYPAWQTVMALVDAHPALAAASPQASPADMFIGDDLYHNGAFRLMYGFGWLALMNEFRKDPSGRTRFDYGTQDGYEYFMNLGVLNTVNERIFKGEVSTWDEWVGHSTYDSYWQERAVLPMLGELGPAVLNVAGWFDAEDFYGPMHIYRKLEGGNPEHENSLVVGPWRHGGWASERGSSLADIRFDSASSEFYQREVELPFFEHHLKGHEIADLPEALVFETGANRWRRHESWPPEGGEMRSLYLQAAGKLGFVAPEGESGFDEFVADPNQPVPFSEQKLTMPGHDWMVEDQRFVADRADVLSYQTEPLTEALSIAGPIRVKLNVSSSGSDADWVVKLIDVYPADSPETSARTGENMADFQMLLAAEVFRAKFRESFGTALALESGEVTEIAFDLPERYHRFRKGHRLMVQVQSSWFPIIDRNPQVFMDIFAAEAGDFRSATHRVHRSAEAASFIELRVY